MVDGSVGARRRQLQQLRSCGGLCVTSYEMVSKLGSLRWELVVLDHLDQLVGSQWQWRRQVECLSEPGLLVGISGDQVVQMERVESWCKGACSRVPQCSADELLETMTQKYNQRQPGPPLLLVLDSVAQHVAQRAAAKMLQAVINCGGRGEVC